MNVKCQMIDNTSPSAMGSTARRFKAGRNIGNRGLGGGLTLVIIYVRILNNDFLTVKRVNAGMHLNAV